MGDEGRGPDELDTEHLLAELAEETESGVPGSVESPAHPEPDADLEVLLRVADCVAHELNNVFASVVGLASLLEREAPSPDVSVDARAILDASQRGVDLVRNLLGFTRTGKPPVSERIAVPGLVDSTLGVLLRGSTKVQISKDLQPDLAAIAGDPGQIKQVLTYVVSNALQAMPDGGAVSIVGRNVDVAAGDPRLGAGRYVQMRIADTGTGMDPNTLSHAFDPLFSTRPRGPAAGLGLYLAQRTVHRHGGRISLHSKRGVGTTVTILLRAWSAPHQALPASARRPLTGPVKDTVLLVDDDPSLLPVAARLLRAMGYSVITAANGESAIELFFEHKNRIAVVLLDMILPDMNGADVLARLRRVGPRVRVVVFTGHPFDDPQSHATAIGADGFLLKPFTLDQLRQAVAAGG